MINNLVKLPGGVGDNTSTNQVDPNQLSIGVQVEMEHTNDPKIAQEIAYGSFDGRSKILY
jgi:hypothetical protein